MRQAALACVMTTGKQTAFGLACSLVLHQTHHVTAQPGMGLHLSAEVWSGCLQSDAGTGMPRTAMYRYASKLARSCGRMQLTKQELRTGPTATGLLHKWLCNADYSSSTSTILSEAAR